MLTEQDPGKLRLLCFYGMYEITKAQAGETVKMLGSGASMLGATRQASGAL